jgi:hypothetical protein
MKVEIIYTEQYALIVSDEKPLYDHYYFNVSVLAVRTGTDDSDYTEEHLKKVIGHRPLKDAPILEGVPLMPKFTQEDDVERKSRDFVKEIGGSQDQRLAFVDGYLEAKETYKYTEEDLRKVIEASRDIRYVTYSEDELIQSLQTKRLKYFKCEMEQLPSNESFGLDYGSSNLKPKTITNSQGQTELVGEYIYG